MDDPAEVSMQQQQSLLLPQDRSTLMGRPSGDYERNLDTKPFDPEIVSDWTQYLTKSNALCVLMIISLVPTFLYDTYLNNLRSEVHLAIIFVLLFVMTLSVISNNSLRIIVQNIQLEVPVTHPVMLFMMIVLLASTSSTIYYEFSGLSIFVQLLFRAELSILILEVVYLQMLTKEKTALLIRKFIVYRDTMEMLEKGNRLPSRLYDPEVKKTLLIANKPQLILIQRVLTHKLLLSCMVVLLLVILGLINIEFWSQKMKFMIFVYVSFTIPVSLSAYQITHFNEKISVIENDLKIRTFLRVKIFGWVPRRELIFGTVLSLGMNAIRIFVRI